MRRRASETALVSRAREVSAGVLAFRWTNGLEVLLGHPGGPFWARKDDGAWSIPKGVVGSDVDLLTAARREFEEETGFIADGDFVPLRPVRQKSGKVVHAFAVEMDCNPAALSSNTFEIEWPPRSGKRKSFPEFDRAGWFAIPAAERKIIGYQLPFLTELSAMLG